ncbi:MAG TPA: protein kinase [Kofleriaceae bacterium]|nr:protein kinase [Kofleriaceae bacterium]
MRQPVPFGKYLLLDRISVGGMAEVFKAKSYGVEGFEKIIAIKRILPTMGEDRDFIKMFIDEAKIAGQLAHANICQIFELGRIDGSHFIAMEYIWGKDLLQIQNRLRKIKQPMPIPMACFSIAKVLEGLDYAHRKRDPLGRPLEIVHRDCSPQNVLVSYEGEVKVIDFGIAKATSRNSRTMAGVLKGKFGYMSPEQVRGLPLDRRSDIFAIGTMLYECMTGERLFQGETDFSTLEKVRNVDIQAPRSINPLIPEAVEKIILKALAKDVDDRYQWCSEMLADLQAFLMGQDVVFTAKSLSQWLKEVFAQEIERERQLLEQYKRVGRDGLIAGAPAAESKLNVVEELGEAGVPEGDSTMLGGPDFADMEHGVGATPDVNQSPGGRAGNVNAPLGNKKAPAPQPAPVAAKPAPGYQEDEEGEGDFGEEAPTEIFGDDPAAATPPPAAAARPNVLQPLGKKGPSNPPPAGRPSTQQPAQSPQGMAAAAGGAMQPAVGRVPTGDVAPMGGGYHPPAATPYPSSQPYGTPPGSQPAQGGPGMAMGTPGGMAASGLAQQGDGGEGPQRTVLGVQAPPGLPNYANFRPSQQQPAMNPNMQSYPGYQQPGQTPPSGYGYQQGYPQQGQQGQYPGMPQGMYGSGPMNAMNQSGATPIDQLGGATPMPNEGKKSTLVRDIAIGVGIAALVLVGFLVVKMFVLDKDTTAGNGSAAPVSKLANVKIKMPAGMTAEMEVDGSRVATVENGREIALSPGKKHIKLTGKDGLTCDDPKVDLEAGKTALLVCGFGQDQGSAAVPNAGSATTDTTGAGSATTQVAQGGTTGTTTTDTKTDVKTTTDTKTDAKADTKTDTKTGTHDVTTTKTDTKTDAKTDTKTGTGTGTGSAATSTTKTDAKTGTTGTTTKTDTKTGTGTTATKTDAKTGTGTSTTATKTGTGTTGTTGTDTKTDTKTEAKGDPNKGYLQVFSKPNAKILVDGVDTNLKTPISGHSLSLAPGKHKITFVIGDDRFTYPVMIKAGQTEQMSKDLQ